MNNTIFQPKSFIKRFIFLMALMVVTNPAYAALTPQDQQAMTAYLEELATGWDQSSVNGANVIFQKTVYNAADWQTFFEIYFNTHKFTPDLWNYLMYPTFAWFDDATRYKLQAGLSQTAKTKINSIYLNHSNDLGQFLDSSATERNDILHWCYVMYFTGTKGAFYIDRRANFNWLKQLIASYPDLLRANRFIDPTTRPYANALRMQLHIVLGDTLALTSPVKAEIASALQLDGPRLNLWNSHSILIHDNQFLATRDYQFLQSLYDSIPPQLTLPRNITVNDALGNSGSRFLPSPYLSSPNVFAIHVGTQQENAFPDDVSPFVTDTFSGVALHETNHVISFLGQEGYIGADPVLIARYNSLVQDAGSDHLNYLRSMFPDGFFVQAPQEFFASISNMYFANTELTLEVGKRRLQQMNRFQPIEQFLFFMDIFSQYSNVSRGYRVDSNGILTSYNIPLLRDNQSRITGFSLPTSSYAVSYSATGHVSELLPAAPIPPAPTLLAARTKAIALDSVTLVRDPFTVTSANNFSLDRHTRIMLFATDIELQAGEDISVVSVQAEDPQQRVFALAVEFVGKVPNFNMLTQINVRLPDELVNADSVWVSISLRGARSNKVITSIR